MRFLIVPADLEPRQLLIYSWMYKHSNQTKENYEGLSKNEVYASARLISKYTEIPHSTVTRQLLKMEVGNYIRCVFKSKTDKVSSKYFLTFNAQLNEPVHEPVGEPVHEPDSEPVVTIETKGIERHSEPVHEPVSKPLLEPVYEPISSNMSSNVNLVIESSNKANRYKTIYDRWNEANIQHHAKLTDVMKTNIDKALKNSSIDEIILAIDRYKEMYHSKYESCKYKWTLNEFITREKGFKYFLDEGDKWINYKKYFKEDGQAKTINDPWANIES